MEVVAHKAVPFSPDDAGHVNAFLPIVKIDVEQRMVWGWASTPDLDLQDEIVPIETIKAALPGYLEWSNIREMHQPSAVGVCKQAEILAKGEHADAPEKEGLFIGCHIVDDNAWKKVITKVYKGFSIGGEVVRKIGKVIKELVLYEISLVDRPANSLATIEYWKAAGLSAPVTDKAGAEGDDAEAVSFGRPHIKFLRMLCAPFLKEYGADGFSKPAPGPDAATGPTATSQQPQAVATPRGEASNPEGYVMGFSADDADLPQEMHRRLVSIKGQHFLFGMDGKSLGEYPDVKAAKARALAHCEGYKALAADAEFQKDDAAKPKGEYGAQSEAGYADAGYQADGRPRYPLKENGQLSEGRIRAAWTYIQHGDNRKAYAPEHLKTVENRIIAAWKAKVDADGPPRATDKFVQRYLEWEMAMVKADATATPAGGELVQALDALRQASASFLQESQLEGDDPADTALADRVDEEADAVAELLDEYGAHEDAESAAGGDDDDTNFYDLLRDDNGAQA